MRNASVESMVLGGHLYCMGWCVKLAGAFSRVMKCERNASTSGGSVNDLKTHLSTCEQ